MSSSDDDDNPEISGSDTDGSGEDLPPVKPATPPPKLDAKAARKAKKREHLVFEREEDAFPLATVNTKGVLPTGVSIANFRQLICE